SLETARNLAGHYESGDRSVDLVERNGKVFLTPFTGGIRVEVRALGNRLIVADRLAFGSALESNLDQLKLSDDWMRRRPVSKPKPCPARWAGLIGEYGWNHDVLYILEKEGRLHALIEWFFEYPLKEEGPGRFRFPGFGLYSDEPVIVEHDTSGRATQIDAGSVVFRRRHLDGEDGKTFRITPTKDIAPLKERVA